MNKTASCVETSYPSIEDIRNYPEVMDKFISENEAKLFKLGVEYFLNDEDKFRKVQAAAITKYMSEHEEEVKDKVVSLSRAELIRMSVNQFTSDNFLEVQEEAVARYLRENDMREEALEWLSQDDELRDEACQMYIDTGGEDEVFDEAVAYYLRHYDVRDGAIEKYIEDNTDEVRNAAIERFSSPGNLESQR